jgi:hypothetical protein
MLLIRIVADIDLFNSVVDQDPHPDPYDSYMFLGLTDPHPDPLVTKYGSGSGSFHHQAKIVRKTLLSTVM